MPRYSIAEDRKEQVLQQYRRSKITYFGGYEKYYLSALNLLGSMEVATSDEEIHKLFSTGLYLMELGRFDESEQKYLDALRVIEQQNSEINSIQVLYAFGMLLIKRKDFEGAKQKIHQAIEVAKKVNALRSIHHMDNILRYINLNKAFNLYSLIFL